MKQKTARINPKRHVQPAVFTLAQASEYLAVSVDTIRRMLNRGDLPVVRLGRLVRIPADAVRRMAGESSTSPASRDADNAAAGADPAGSAPVAS